MSIDYIVCLIVLGRQKMIGKFYDPKLVSIITPAYNCSGTISETINSVIAQTYINWEMVIVDDASKDNTLEVIECFLKQDKRIKLLKLEKNSGAAVARNTAIRNATGRYIAFLDSDDLWKRDKLEKQIKYMNDNSYAFTFTAYETFRDSKDLSRRVFNVPKTINYEQYIRNTIIGNLTVIIDRSKIIDFHIEPGYLEDVLTWMYYLRKGYLAYGLNENLASYRVYINSKSGNKLKNAVRYWECLKNVQKLSFAKCCVCEFYYIFNAIKKRLFGQIVAYNEKEIIKQA